MENNKLGHRKRLGSYDYNPSENSLSEEERKQRAQERMLMFMELRHSRNEGAQEHPELAQQAIGGEFSRIFSQLLGQQKAGTSASTPEELERYSDQLQVNLKWVEALAKELSREKQYIDELHGWLTEQEASPLVSGTDRPRPER